MELFEALEARRAVKHFDANFVMPEQHVQDLMAVVMKSPTSFNMQNWRFVLVKDTQKRQQIRSVSWDQAQMTEASLLIVLCADLKAWAKKPERYWAHAPQAVQDILLPALGRYYRDDLQKERDEAMRSCGIAAQTLMLAAKGLGYDSCPMVGFDFDEVGKLIRLPQDHVISMIITVGKCVKRPWARGGQLSLAETVFTNTF